MIKPREPVLDMCARADDVVMAMREAARRAIALHRAYDRPLVCFRDGKVVYLSADETEQGLKQ